MKNAWTNPNRSFTLLPFPFHWARDSSLSEHPSLPQALAPRFNILCACRDAFDLESAFKNTTSFNLFINSLALWYYHFHCNTKDRKLRSIEGLHKVIVNSWRTFSPLSCLPLRPQISRNPKLLQRSKKSDSLDPLHVPHFPLLTFSQCRSLSKSTF